MKEQIEKINNQANNIETNLNYIKENISKNKEPIFIELIGTAKSGKTTLLNNITKLLTKNGIPVQKRAETAEYNPIENKDLEEYNIWMYSELIKNLSEDMSDNTPRVVIYDRGMLDRLSWIDFSVNDGSIPNQDAVLLKQMFNSEFMKKYKPLTYGFVTSPELSVHRKGKEGRLVNRKNVKLFNECMEAEKEVIKEGAKKYTTIETDPYQGNIKQFIMDLVETITEDVKENIRENIEIREQKTIDDL